MSLLHFACSQRSGVCYVKLTRTLHSSSTSTKQMQQYEVTIHVGASVNTTHYVLQYWELKRKILVHGKIKNKICRVLNTGSKKLYI